MTSRELTGFLPLDDSMEHEGAEEPSLPGSAFGVGLPTNACIQGICKAQTGRINI